MISQKWDTDKKCKVVWNTHFCLQFIFLNMNLFNIFKGIYLVVKSTPCAISEPGGRRFRSQARRGFRLLNYTEFAHARFSTAGCFFSLSLSLCERSEITRATSQSGQSVYYQRGLRARQHGQTQPAGMLYERVVVGSAWQKFADTADCIVFFTPSYYTRVKKPEEGT